MKQNTKMYLKITYIYFKVHVITATHSKMSQKKLEYIGEKLTTVTTIPVGASFEIKVTPALLGNYYW